MERDDADNCLCQGLGSQINIQVAIYDDNVSLKSFTQRAVRISQRLTTCLPVETALSQASPTSCPPVPEPMQVDTNRLTCTEYARCLAMCLCLYCGASGNLIKKCPSRPPRQGWIGNRAYRAFSQWADALNGLRIFYFIFAEDDHARTVSSQWPIGLSPVLTA